MNFIVGIKTFLNNLGKDKLFLTFIPCFCATISANNTFNFNLINGIIFIFAVILIQLGVQVFDDFIDWITCKTAERKDLEQTGVRVLYSKGNYMLTNKKNARLYFYISAVLILTALIVLSILCKKIQDYKLLINIPILITFGLIYYLPLLNKYTNKLGTEIIIAIICAPITIVSTFYASAKCLIPQLYAISVIFFFMIFNLCYISSMLNIKSDILTKKTTFPMVLNNEKYEIYFSLFFTIFPFVLTYLSISLKLLPIYSYITFLILPQALWQFYLMYKFKKAPQDNVKWHILMGEDSHKIENEQNNISWYSVRYNFARNIYIAYGIILAVSLINFSELSAF